jgi:CHASE1-domain containing sensor protein
MDSENDGGTQNAKIPFQAKRPGLDELEDDSQGESDWRPYVDVSEPLAGENRQWIGLDADITETRRAWRQAHYEWQQVLTKDAVDDWYRVNALWDGVFTKFNV